MNQKTHGGQRSLELISPLHGSSSPPSKLPASTPTKPITRPAWSDDTANWANCAIGGLAERRIKGLDLEGPDGWGRWGGNYFGNFESSGDHRGWSLNKSILFVPTLGDWLDRGGAGEGGVSGVSHVEMAVGEMFPNFWISCILARYCLHLETPLSWRAFNFEEVPKKAQRQRFN
jgi:hypothetical protein